MNSPFKFVAAALLFSTVPAGALVSDYNCSRSDYNCLERVAANTDDIQATLLFLLVDKLPDKFSCSFDVKGRTKKAIVKHFINRFLLNNSLDIVADLPNAGSVSVLTTDQAMEVGLVVFNDLFDKRSGSEIVTHAGKTFVREKVVAALVWLLAQTNVEALLPDSLTSSAVYTEARNEVGRHFVDKAIEKALK